MSDKVTKIRVNGVEKEIGGTGGGGGGISGAYLAPGRFLNSDYTGYTSVTINPLALIEQLEAAGVPVDEPAIDEYETQVNYNIGESEQLSSGTLSYSTIITLTIASYRPGKVAISLFNGYPIDVDTSSTTLRDILSNINVDNIYANLPNTKFISNCIDVVYTTAGETLHYYIPDMTEFCEEVLVEYHPSSN